MTGTESQPKQTGKRTPMILAACVVIAVAGWLVLRLNSGARRNDSSLPTVLNKVVSPGAAAGFNLLLITLDTTRPDRLGCYGYEGAQTPTLDALAANGVRFDDAITTVPITLPSHASILTGLYPPTMGVRANGVNRLAPEYMTLAEVLRDRNYETSAFVSCFVLEQRFGLAQGFDTFEFDIESNSPSRTLSLQNERRADHVTSSAIRWLGAREEAGGERPFFMWVHYFDPHHPYDSPLFGLPGTTTDPYDAEIAFMDLHLKRLIATLDEKNLRKRTLIVIASDHGESLYEHDEPGHAIFVYESSMRAVMILSCPTLFDKAYRVDDRVVALVDIFPTVSDLMDLPKPSQLDGQSLLSDQSPDRAIYIESFYPKVTLACSPLRGLRRHQDKFILAPRREYYDLKADPKELNNRYYAGHEQAKALEDQLGDVVAASDEQAGDRALHALSADEIARLESLGYAAPSAGDAIDVSECDPKDRVAYVNEMGKVHALIAQNSLDEAISLATVIMEDCEGWVAPVRDLAQMYEKTGRPSEAAKVLKAFVERYQDIEMLCRLAAIYLKTGSDKGLEEALDAAEMIDPDMGAIAILRGDWHLARNRPEEAIRQFERAVQIDPVRAGSEARQKLVAARRALEEQSTP